MRDKKNLVQIGNPSEESGQTPQLAMPTITKPTVSGLMSIVMRDPFEVRVDVDVERVVAENAEHTRYGHESTVSSDTTHIVRHVLRTQFESADKEQNPPESSTEALRQSNSVSYARCPGKKKCCNHIPLIN